MSYGDGYYYGRRKRVTKAEIKKRNATRKVNQETKLLTHILGLKKENPDKYSASKIYMSRQSAINNNGGYWWAKCKRGHICERPVSANSCTVCSEVNKALRDKRIKEAVLKLTIKEQVALAEFYNKAKRLTKETGVQYHVDHIRPIAAGGSHHPNNLQVITAHENLQKGSEYDGKKRKYSKKEKAEVRKQFEEKRGLDRLKIKLTKKPKKVKTIYNDGSLTLIFFVVAVIVFVGFFKSN
jgi:5-methylcytosine-specific restriction endonuclease McrA